MGNQLIPRNRELWDPFNALGDLRGEIDRLMGSGAWPAVRWSKNAEFRAPDVDVKDELDAVLVKADIPGIKKEDLSITVEGDVLTLKGERKESEERKEKDLFFSERFHGQFERTLTLPSKVQNEGAKAIYKDGVLEIRLLKDQKAKAREVKVQIQ